MFYLIDSHRGMKPGDTVLYNGFPVKLTRLERIPGGVAADVQGISGISYPHPVYHSGFTVAADNLRVPA